MDPDLLKSKLREEATCSVCLDYFTEPVVLDCGHNFCRDCIARCWTEFPSNTACPQCRKAVLSKNCRPNRPLANVVGILKQLNHQEKDKSGEIFCSKHPEPSEVVFCKEDHVSVCLVCEGPEQHKDHHVVPLEEAAQEYKDRFARCIEVLKNEKEEIKRTETEKQKTMAEFREFHQYLVDQENFLLAKIQAIARDVTKKRNEILCKLSAELFVIQNNVRQLVDKSHGSLKEFLQVAEKTLEKCEKRPKFKLSEAFPLGLKWEIWDLRDLNVLLEGAAKHFKGLLQEGYPLKQANVTLDPETAHPQLLLSNTLKNVSWTETPQDVPKTFTRFEKHYCVMGCQEFTAGRHYWDVIVEGDKDWAVGVASSYVRRAGHFALTAEAGFFAMGKGAKYCRTHRIPEHNEEHNEEIRKIRVSLNCAGGQVVFYDAERAKKVFAFTQASFHKETLLPFFWLRGKTQLNILTH
uniref:E3 ubiquitin-protein ligase TRIM7-like n=1 Tax=Euleptes europaea TaxID=460621 RepID=UPI002540B220|nr:E3 ubiquitin-protein ligase TRIM7-like [Euleptes europaea]